MFLIDAPYASGFLRESVRTLGLPVLDTPQSRRLAGEAGLEFIDKAVFAARLGAGEKIMSNSENGLEHILSCGCGDDLARMIDVCKDKALYRETIADLHPDYVFRRVPTDGIASFDPARMPFPLIVKPTRGFFSLGVHMVKSADDWPQVAAKIEAERAAMNAEYPEGVVDAGEFIAEQAIPGEEYAVDVYFDADGAPVIINILHHHFISEDDVSDRFYYTSTAVMEQYLDPFTEYLDRMGRACGFRNFPIHIELRVTGEGEIIPIEANPLRFAGWCVADITHHAWGFNPYEFFFENKRPDWPAILKEYMGTACGMVIGTVPPETDRAAITSIDFDAFLALFDEVLEVREIDYSEYPVFAFVFARMPLERLDAFKEEIAVDFGRFVVQV